MRAQGPGASSDNWELEGRGCDAVWRDVRRDGKRNDEASKSIALRRWEVHIHAERGGGGGLPTSWSSSLLAILRRMRRMILPDRVFGRPGAQWMTSGVATGPMCWRTSAMSSLRSSCR